MCGRNNQPNTLPLILDFHTLGNIHFCLIDDKNQIRALPDNVTLTFAGSVKMGEISQNILFLSTTYTVSEDNVINFTVDTYTEPFLNQIKKKNTEINVEISIKFEDGHQKLLLRDYAYACPRVYIEGVPPTPVESYYTKDEVDSLINGVIEDIPTKTSELINDSGYITSSQIDLSDYYTKEETNAKLDEKADKTAIPTKTSELTNDSGFITSSQIDLNDYYTKEETNTKLSEKADKTAIPTKTSELTNDSGFITEQDVVYPVNSVNGKTGNVILKTSDLINDSGFIKYRDTIARKIKYDTDTTDSVINVTFNPAYYIYYKTNYNISGGVMYFGAPSIPTGGDFVSSERVITFEVWVPASSEITTFTFNVIVPIDFPETLPLLDNQDTTTHVFVYRMFWPTADNSNILNYKYQISYSYSF